MKNLIKPKNNSNFLIKIAEIKSPVIYFRLFLKETKKRFNNK